MELNIQTAGAVQIIGMAGELNSDTSSGVYDRIMNELTPTEPNNVVIDMSNVRFMSSAGIRTLLLLYRSITDFGGQVVLVGMSDDLRDILAVTGFLEFFKTSNSIDAGLQAIQ